MKLMSMTSSSNTRAEPDKSTLALNSDDVLIHFMKLSINDLWDHFTMFFTWIGIVRVLQVINLLYRI